MIIADEVVVAASADYLTDLYAKLQRIDEFELVDVRIESIPKDRKGQEFCNRFLRGQTPTVPAITQHMRKKARIMQH